MRVFKRLNWFMCAGLSMLSVACSSGSEFTLNSDSNVFQQSVSRSQVKVDILWVVDNSGSMETSQDNVAANFQSFIEKFQNTNFDYQIAVTTTEAWKAGETMKNNPEWSRFRDGTDATSYTGVTVIKPDTPNLEDTFITNIKQGIKGSGDERGWQSLKEALSHPDNLAEPFPREDSILAVIFLTDEDDFSWDGATNVQGLENPYDNPDLHDPMDYYDFLYDLTGSSEGKVKFIVNTIGIWDEQCRDDLNSSFIGRRIARRYEEVTDATGGYKGSLCDDFSGVLAGISDTILQKTTAFQLDRMPADGTLKVIVDGNDIPESAENGWTFDEANLQVIFHGSAIPGSDSVVNITFDPAGLK